MQDTRAQVAGWYGKIPALGDFASRRLPPDFISSWDAWLQRALAASHETLREQWQEVYLTSPIWRFALLPGVCGNFFWTGIMMPSVDHVGRHFPLTIAMALDPYPETIATVFAAQEWFEAIEQIALSSLSMSFQVDELEDRLAATHFGNPLPAGHAGQSAVLELPGWWEGPGHSPIALSLPDLDLIGFMLAACRLNLLTVSGIGKSLWWTRDEMARVSQLHGFAGLPPENHFATLLAGVVTAQRAS